MANLIARYAELIDAGDFDGMAELLGDAAVGAGDGPSLLTGQEAMRGLFAATTRLYPDGTPGTKHVTTNLILEIDDGAGPGSGPVLLDRPPGRARPPPPAHPGRPLPRPLRAAATACGGSPSGGT